MRLSSGTLRRFAEESGSGSVPVQTEVRDELLNERAEVGQPTRLAARKQDGRYMSYPGAGRKSPWREKQEAARSDCGRHLEWRMGSE